MIRSTRIYTVWTEWPEMDFGTRVSPAGEQGMAFPTWDEAYDHYADVVDEDHPTRVLMMDLDPDTMEPEATNDVTFEFASELGRICAARDLPNPLAAE